jgi:hypothetical protein
MIRIRVSSNFWNQGLLVALLSLGALNCNAKDIYRKLTLSQLGAFDYESPETSDSALDAWVDSERTEKNGSKKFSIPAWVKKLEGAKIAVPGFMMPFDVDDDGVANFTLVKSIMNCCYGVAPKLNEFINCTMLAGKKAAFLINVPILVSGTLHLDEVKADDGELLSLYDMDVDKVEKIDQPDPELLKGAYPVPVSRTGFEKGSPP